jgi:hypothetical protein
VQTNRHGHHSWIGAILCSFICYDVLFLWRQKIEFRCKSSRRASKLQS